MNKHIVYPKVVRDMRYEEKGRAEGGSAILKWGWGLNRVDKAIFTRT